jgi:hypothetical protein
MLTVVGGIGYVSGALFGGLAAGVLFVTMQNTFDKLGTDHRDLEGLFEFLANLTLVLPALMGVSIGRNPTGAVERIVVDFGPVRRVRPVLVGAIAAVGAGYLLARNGTISNWWFVVIVLAVIAAMPAAARKLAPEAYATLGWGAQAAPVGGAGTDVPLELVGVSRPYTAADREMLDAALGVGSETGRRPESAGVR